MPDTWLPTRTVTTGLIVPVAVTIELISPRATFTVLNFWFDPFRPIQP